MNDYLKLMLGLIFSFILCVILCKFHLRFLNLKPKDQIEVYQLNPKHKFKSCGGIDFILSTSMVFIILNINNINKSFICLLFTFIYFGIIGLLDDLIKVLFKDNKGLSVISRILLEIIGVFVICNLTSINLMKFISFNNMNIYIGPFAIIYCMLCIIGCCNGINLTDGLDGLASITYILACTPFVYIALIQHNFIVSSFLVCLIGSLLAFLLYNFNPSKIIMGDVGSLSLGSILAVSSILLNKEILLLISGLIFIIEIVSVILQVSYFKITKGKRIFLMTPIHYHFLKKGMKESNVVLMFTIIGIFLSILATIIGVIK